MYIPTNVAKPANSAGGGSPKNPNLTIIRTGDVATWPARDDKGVLIAGNIVLKTGAQAISVYVTPTKIKAGYEPEGDEDSQTFKHKLEAPHPGDSLAVNEFVQNYSGEPCIIIVGSCGDASKRIYGTECAPIYLKPSGTDENDNRNHMLVFEQYAKRNLLPAHYTGVIPVNIIPVVNDVTVIGISETDHVLKLPPNTGSNIAFDEILAPHDAIISLIGTGGANPAVLVSGNTSLSALLVNGASWVALDGDVIHLKVFRAGNVQLLIEQSRG
jgi:hypothetical protein